jgi:ankyrin repeat protein
MTPLHHAALRGQLDTMKCLIEAGSSIDEKYEVDDILESECDVFSFFLTYHLAFALLFF